MIGKATLVYPKPRAFGQEVWPENEGLRFLQPAMLLAEPSDLGRVVPAVPRVVAERSLQAESVAHLGVDEGAGELRLSQGAQQLDPAQV